MTFTQFVCLSLLIASSTISLLIVIAVSSDDIVRAIRELKKCGSVY